MFEGTCVNQTISFHKLFLFVLKRTVHQPSFMNLWVVNCILATIHLGMKNVVQMALV